MGSIPAEGTRTWGRGHLKVEKGLKQKSAQGGFLLCLKEFGDLRLAASCRILLYDTALERLIDRLVGCAECCLIAFRGEACCLGSGTHSLLAHLIHSALAK